MKKFKIDDMEMMIVGTANEIKAVYKAIRRAACGKEHSWKTNIFPFYEETPNFVRDRIYGLIIDENNWMSVVSEHTALDIITDCFSLEVVA